MGFSIGHWPLVAGPRGLGSVGPGSGVVPRRAAAALGRRLDVVFVEGVAKGWGPFSGVWIRV